MPRENMRRTSQVKLSVRIGPQGGYNKTACSMLFDVSKMSIVGTKKAVYNNTDETYYFFNTVSGEADPSGTELLTVIEYNSKTYLVTETFNAVLTAINLCCNIPNETSQELVITLKGQATECNMINGGLDSETLILLTIEFSDISLVPPGTVLQIEISFIFDGVTSLFRYDVVSTDFTLDGMNITIVNPTPDMGENGIEVGLYVTTPGLACSVYSFDISVANITGLVDTTYTSNVEPITTNG